MAFAGSSAPQMTITSLRAKVIPAGDILRFTHVDSAEGISEQVPALLQPTISNITRAQLLHLQKDRLADDQMDYLLRDVARASTCPTVMIETALLLSAVQHQSHETIQLRLRELRLHNEFGVVGALPIAGHWVTFAWVCHNDSVAAWSSYAPRVSDDCIGVANCVLGRARHRSLSQFRFLDGPIRPLNGPHCGRYALSDLRSLVASQPFLAEDKM